MSSISFDDGSSVDNCLVSFPFIAVSIILVFNFSCNSLILLYLVFIISTASKSFFILSTILICSLKGGIGIIQLPIISSVRLGIATALVCFIKLS